MKKYKIVLLSGDGIGPEISEVSKKVLKKLSKNHNFEIEIIEKLFGGIAYEKYGTPAPDETLDQCKNCLLYTSPSPRDRTRSRMPSSA